MADISSMTREELMAAAKRHDSGHNESGYGYNPYRAELDRRDMEELEAGDDTQDRINALMREINALDHGRISRGDAEAVARYNALNAEIAALKAQQ